MFTKRRALICWTAMMGLFFQPISLPMFAQDGPPSDGGAQALLRTPAELDTLLAPIALYPDPLLAQILPASTAPQDVILASRFLAAQKDPATIDQQPWEESVKALARYPDVLKMMDEKFDWTNELGNAFAAQPDDVFASVQRLRAQAAAVGNLTSTPQQTIVHEKEIIQILPADPQVIYVPQYSPTVVYTQAPTNPAVPLLAFGAGLAMGVWIHNEVDWHNHGVYYHNDGWHGGGYGGGGNSININNNNNVNVGNGNGGGSVWKPSRPGNGGGNNGNGGNRPGNGNNGGGGNRPGNGNNGAGGNRPGNGNNGAGNKPPITGTKPAKPGLGNGGGGQNRPQNKPFGGAFQRPAGGGGGSSNRFSREGSKPFGGGGSGGGRFGGGGGAAAQPRAGGGNRNGGGGGSAATRGGNRNGGNGASRGGGGASRGGGGEGASRGGGSRGGGGGGGGAAKPAAAPARPAPAPAAAPAAKPSGKVVAVEEVVVVQQPEPVVNRKNKLFSV